MHSQCKWCTHHRDADAFADTGSDRDTDCKSNTGTDSNAYGCADCEPNAGPNDYSVTTADRIADRNTAARYDCLAARHRRTRQLEDRR
jgi:hypothetical protein